jgi:hypothetical protein
MLCCIWIPCPGRVLDFIDVFSSKIKDLTMPDIGISVLALV